MSATVTITLELAMKPEAVEPFRTQISGMLEETRKFAGFVDIRILGHADDPTRIIFIEEWASRAAYEAYIKYRTETGAMDMMAAMITQPPRLDCWNNRIA